MSNLVEILILLANTIFDHANQFFCSTICRNGNCLQPLNTTQ
jgi:hypothetical protein